MAGVVGGSVTDPVFTATAGDADALIVTQVGPDTLVFDDGAVAVTTAVAGCAAVAGDVTCVAPGGTVNSVTANLGDLNDSTTFTDVTVPIVANGGDGNDTVSGSNGVTPSTTLNGDAGDDTLNGRASAATLNGGDGADSIFGSAGNDVINGGAGNDTTLSGEAGDDTINGGDGDDSMTGGAGADDIHGGASVNGDSVSYQPTAANLTVTVDDLANDAGEGDNVHSDVESVQTGDGADTLTGGPGAQFLDAGVGDDSIDIIDGAADIAADCGDGNDVLYADAADLPNPFTTCEATADKDAMSFGSLTVGGSTAAQTVTVINTGTVALPLGTAAITGAFNKTADTCTNANLAAGATCTVSASFAPAAAGAAGGTLTIPTAGRAFSIPLSGTGVAAAVVTPPGTTPPPPPPPPPPAITPTLPTAKSVSVKAKPTRDRSRPYKFAFSGTVGLPAGVTKAKGCSGTVTITLKKGKRTVTSKKATLKKDCTYAAKVTVTRKAKMKATARFGGNKAVKARSSAAINVRAG